MSARAYYDGYWAREAPPPLADPLAARRLEVLRSMLAEVSASTVLDVGCGHGDLVAALAGDGLDAVGMDVSARAVALASSKHAGCRFVEHSAEGLPWPVRPGSYDAVVAFEVIEHLLRPRNLLLGARAALAPGGFLALTTPYHGLAKNAAIALLGFDRHFAVEGDHIRFFSDRSLRQLLVATGFETFRTVHFGRTWPVWSGVFVWGRRVD